MPIPPSRPAHRSAVNHPDASSARAWGVRSLTVACANVAVFGSLCRLGYGSELLAGLLYGLSEHGPGRIPISLSFGARG